MHSIKYIPSGLANDPRWAASLNDGEIDEFWNEIEEKQTMGGKPLKMAELHDGGRLEKGGIVGSTRLKRVEFLSICYTGLDDGVATYYTSVKEDVLAKWNEYKETGMLFGKKAARAILLEGGEIKPNGFVYGAKVLEKFPASPN